jgi:hypothetical protein
MIHDFMTKYILVIPYDYEHFTYFTIVIMITIWS